MEESSSRTGIIASALKPGQPDPWGLGLIVECLIEIEEGKWIVFLDKNLDTWWRYDGAAPDGYGEVAARVAQLEAIPIDKLSAAERKAFRSLVANGMARTFDGEGAKTSQLVLNQAEEYVRARLIEKSRAWLVSIGLAAAFVLTATVTCAADLGVHGLREGLLAVGSSGLGACFWLVAREGKFPQDPNGGFLLHLFEALARIAVAMLSGWLVLLCVKSRLLFSGIEGNTGLMLVCFAAGATERFVPDLVQRVNGERIAGTPKARPSSEPVPRPTP
jgi:hypothetical protein